MQQQLPNIYHYTDYRRFLKEWIAAKKRTNSKYSYRYFSAKSGFSSTNFLSLVVNGKRNLTNASIGKISKGLGLSKNKRTFFEHLVFMNQAATHEEKDHYYQRMLHAKPNTEFQIIDKIQYEYFSRWYHPVIREMIEFAPQPLDPEWLATFIQPPISAKQVENSIKLLLKLDLIEEYIPGIYRKKEAVLTTGSEVRALQITNFHKQMAELADSALERFPSEQRDISGIILSINTGSLTEIKEMIASFRNQLAEMAAETSDENAVVYIQIRAFPLTMLYKEK